MSNNFWLDYFRMSETLRPVLKLGSILNIDDRLTLSICKFFYHVQFVGIQNAA